MATRPTSAAPFLLRLVLGITFLWAGMGKLFAEFPASGERAARLANWGVLPLTRPAAVSPPPLPRSTPPTPTMSDPHPDPDARPVPTEPLPETDAPERTKGRSPAGVPPTNPRRGDSDAARITLARYQGTGAIPEDFPDPVPVRRVYGIALMVYNAAHPAPNSAGITPMPLWPKAAASGRWPVYFAWGAAIAELAGGGLLLLGLLTRLAALSIAGTMLVAVWLTEIGPALQSGRALMGFLPAYADGYKVALSPDGYVTLLWQLALLSMALAISMLGPGMLALDLAMAPRAAPAPRAPKPPIA